MAEIVRFPVRSSQPKPYPSASLMKTAAAAAVTSGLPRQQAADALRRVAAALDRRQG